MADIESPSSDLEPGAGESPLRLWRLRRRQHAMDAQIVPLANSGTELRLVYDGRPVYRRRWATRDDAVREALARRTTLERAGWMRHW